MYCKFCGSKLKENETVCSSCGGSVAEQKKGIDFENIINRLIQIICCIASVVFPISGFCLYLICREKYPVEAKYYLMAGILVFAIKTIPLIITYFKVGW